MELTANKREPGKAKTLRSRGHIPGVVYNKNVNIPVSVELRAFDKVFRSQGTSSIIDLDIDGDSREVLVKAVQMDKRRREPRHIDFYEVTAGQTVEVGVHINLVGTAAGIKEGGMLDVQRREVLIRVLPRLIPHDVELDISEMVIGDSRHISDIVAKLPAEAELLDDPESTIVTMVPPRIEEEPEPVEELLEPALVGEEGEEGEGEEGAEPRAERDADDE